MKTAMTADQFKRLVIAQNHPANINEDIISYVNFFKDNKKVENHIKKYEHKATVYSMTNK
jgi:hypothetical protein